MSGRKILVLEDDSEISSVLCECLNSQGYVTYAAANLKEGREAIRNTLFDLFLLDVNLPDGTSLAFCQDLRELFPSTPTVFLSSNLKEDTILQGFTAGALDYLRKPIGRKELLWRVGRYLKEKQGHVQIGNILINMDSKVVTCGQAVIDLTKTEFAILAVLAQQIGCLVERTDLVNRINPEKDLSDAALNNHLWSLRNKFKKAEVTGLEIVSLYGEGYRLETR